MGPAVELFLLVLIVLGGGLAAGAYFTRPLWQRAAKTIMEKDREERLALEEQARERAEQAECRRRAEEELQRSLRGEDVPGMQSARKQPSSRREPVIPCEEPKQVQSQSQERP